MRFELGLLLLRRAASGSTAMLRLEVCKVLDIVVICIGLFICRKLNVISLFGCVRLGFEWFLALWVQLLPPVTYKFCYLSEREVLLFHFLSNLIREYHIRRGRPLGRVLIGLGMTTILSFRLVSWGLRSNTGLKTLRGSI